MSYYRFGLSRYRQLSNRKRILIFPPEFPDIPRKISAYLRTDSSSGANTRKIRGFYNVLNINNLCLRGISPLCKKHHFGLQNGPFRRLKSTISHPEMGFIAPRNGQYQKAERTFPVYDIGYMKGWYRLKRLQQRFI